VAGVLVGIGLAVVMATVALLLTGEEDEPVEIEQASVEEAPAEPSDEEAERDPDEDQDPPTPTSVVTAPPSTTQAPPSNGLPPGRWAALLYASTDRGPADAQSGALGHLGPVRVLTSSNFTTLKPGLYVVYVDGFDTADQAIEFCYDAGRFDESECYARYLSQDPSVTWNVPGTDQAGRPRIRPCRLAEVVANVVVSQGV